MTMNLKHIALSINDTSDIENFYSNILNMKEVKSFILGKDFAEKLFDISHEASVRLLKRDGLFLEIFITQEENKQGFNHICLTVNNREELFNKAVSGGYECIRIERESFDLIFIKDKSGNSFELQEQL